MDDTNAWVSYIAQWIKFDVFNFICWYCGGLNKTIVIDRLYQYAQKLNYCRICAKIQPSRRSKADKSQFKFNTDLIKSLNHANDNDDDDAKHTTYEIGNLVRYELIACKYKTFAEEILLNAVYNMSLSVWNHYLQKAKTWLTINIDLINNASKCKVSEETNVVFGICQYEPIDI
eukprot:705864_1